MEKLEQCEVSDCILWNGAKVGGYGVMAVAGDTVRANRMSYLIFNGPIPTGMLVRHTCDTPACSSPFHLELGTHKDNTADLWKRGRGNPPRGERAWNHVLTEVGVSEIKTHIINGTMTQMALSRKYGAKKSTINAIRLGLSWAHVEPKIPKDIPQPHRKMSAQDHIDILNKWNSGASLEKLASEYGCRVDTIVKIKAKIAKKMGLPHVSRFQKPRHSDEIIRQLLARKTAGERTEDLAAEIGLSHSGLGYAFARVKEAA